MALTADLKVKFKDGDFEAFYVKAAQQIYLGALVTVKAAGYAYAATDTAGDMFVGVAEENVLGVTDGVEQVKVRRRGVALLIGSGLAIADVGSPAYVSTDGVITVTPGNVLVGTIVGVPDATHAWVALIEGPAVDITAATAAIAGAMTVGTTLTTGGALAVTGAITATTSVTAADLAATDDLTVGDDCAITGLCTIGETLAVTGIATFTGRPVLPTVAFGALGAATTVGQICYCATGHGGLPGILVANGTNWIAPDGATAAET